MEGLKQLFETVNILRDRYHPCYVKILGLLMTFVDEKTLLCRQIERQIREFFDDMVFNTVIHKSVRLAEAPSAGVPVLIYSPDNKAAAEYMNLAEEIENLDTSNSLEVTDETLARR